MMRSSIDHLSLDYVEKVYDLLMSWGMNSRGAKLASFAKFRGSILFERNREIIRSLERLRLEEIDKRLQESEIEKSLKCLFDSLELADKEKPKFVAFSKTMHFLCPSLVSRIGQAIYAILLWEVCTAVRRTPVCPVYRGHGGV